MKIAHAALTRRIIFAFFLLFLTLIFYVWSRYHAVKLGYEFSDLTQQERKLLEEERTLRLELSKLSSLERVEEIARKELGLIEPRSDQVIYLSAKKP